MVGIPGEGGGGAAGGGVAGGVLGSFIATIGGGLVGHLTERTPHVGDTRRQIIREIPGVRVNHGQYYLPAIPGTKYTAPLFTNENKKVLKWYRAYVNALPDPTEGPPGNPDSYPPPAPGTLGGANVPPFLPSIGLPRIPPSIALPGFGSLLSRVAGMGIAGVLLWPGTAGEGSDLRDYYAKNVPKASPSGRRARGRRATRPKVRQGRRPRAVPYPGRGGPVTVGRPNVRAVPPPAVLAGVLSSPPVSPPLAVPGARPAIPPARNVPTSSSSFPATSPWPSSSSSSASSLPSSATPTISTVGTSAPSSTSSVFSNPLVQGLIGLGSYLLPLVSPQASPRANPRQAVAPAPAPLTWPSTAAVPYAATQARECSCAKTKKRRKNECRNPVTKRKRETRGGHRFVTITKRLDCERRKAA